MTLSRYVSSVTHSSRALRMGLTLAGVLTLSVATVSFAQPAHASALACHTAGHTQRCAAARRTARASVRHAARHTTRRTVAHRSGGTHMSSPSSSGSGISAWAPVPGHPTYTMHDFAGDPNARYFGVCTWWAWYNHQSEGMLGNGKDWTRNAAARGYATGLTPRVGATAVFQPGVEGASRLGHVGHVEQVLDNGWFVISEMNFYWNGGGWGKVDYRYVQMEPGVSFVY